MLKKTLYIICFLYVNHGIYAQLTCPDLTGPMDGGLNVPVDSGISWNPVDGITSYLISIGTSPGAGDIINRAGTGNDTTYTPPFGLPENTVIYVTITLFVFDGADVICTVGSFRTQDVTTPPPCTSLEFPMDGATDVDIGTQLSWNYAPSSTGYRLILSTTPGGNDIVDETVMTSLNFEPTSDLPVNTEIFVRIIPFNENGSAPGPCPEYSFITGAVSEIPDCTRLTNPLDGAVNIPLNSTLEWEEVPGADGYRISIGTSPTDNDILDNGIFNSTTAELLDFLPRRTFFVTIIPFNDGGDALGCVQESFSTILGCDPFVDSTSGELVSFSPQIDFPNVVSLCLNDGPRSIVATDQADGYRWYQLNTDDTETLISQTSEVRISEEGSYRYEIYNTVSQPGSVFECSSTKEFAVISSEIPDITNIDVTEQSAGLRIIVEAEGIGDYEFALDANGPFQDSNIFDNLPQGTYTIFVRDKNGCGVAERSSNNGLSPDDFPKFFTPNGDGVNDFWQYDPVIDIEEVDLQTIYIFNRLGALLTRIDPKSQGWDGNLDGVPLPSSDYWFKARSTDNKEIKGHFSLKR
ncbi:T9SS type B sorting domain-containing protein [Ulvibacterium sp.]|uniref:T9SS type B sorting domain-containing protein n=1 Tax=Ulvibacterium sp. TaxID=2665914 RepID=UPI0026289F0D|nr:T9SS type B sorting domain-containing protein [Ulvibacterium sp.]